MKILFLSRWYPYPPNNGSKIRIFNLLKALSKCHQVTLISFYEPSDGLPDTQGLKSFCKQIQVLEWQPFRPLGIHAVLGFFSSKPRSFIDTFSVKLKKLIETTLSNERYDLIIASQIDMAGYAPYFQGIPAIFEEVEVGVLYEQYARARSWSQRLRYGMTWGKHRRFLTSTLHHFGACTVASNREADLLSQVVHDSLMIEVIPNSIDLLDYSNVREAPQPYTLIFTGAFTYAPNYEAMLWFLNEVYDQIVVQVPQAHLTITGNHAGRPLPGTNHVTLTGYVPDIRPLIARSWCSIVPLQAGGGTRLKILEAMALGTPVVATSKGAEGLDVRDGEHLLLADDPAAFARGILSLFANPALRKSVSESAFRLVKEKYNSEVVMPRFLELVERIA